MKRKRIVAMLLAFIMIFTQISVNEIIANAEESVTEKYEYSKLNDMWIGVESYEEVAMYCDYTNEEYPDGKWEQVIIESIEFSSSDLVEAEEREDQEGVWEIKGMAPGELTATVTYYKIEDNSQTAQETFKIHVLNNSYKTSYTTSNNDVNCFDVISGQTIDYIVKLKAEYPHEYGWEDTVFDESLNITLNTDISNDENIVSITEGTLTLSEDKTTATQVYTIQTSDEIDIDENVEVGLELVVNNGEEEWHTDACSIYVHNDFKRVVIEDEEANKKLTGDFKVGEAITFSPKLYSFDIEHPEGVPVENVAFTYETWNEDYVTVTRDGDNLTVTRVSEEGGMSYLNVRFEDEELNIWESRYFYMPGFETEIREYVPEEIYAITGAETATIDITGIEDIVLNPNLEVALAKWDWDEWGVIPLEGVASGDYISVNKTTINVDLKSLRDAGLYEEDSSVYLILKITTKNAKNVVFEREIEIRYFTEEYDTYYDWDGTLGVGAQKIIEGIKYYLVNFDHPDGTGGIHQVESIEASKEGVVEIKKDESTGYWNIIGKAVGTTELTITYKDINGEAKTQTQSVKVIEIVEKYEYDYPSDVKLGVGGKSSKLEMWCYYSNIEYPEGDYTSVDISGVAIADSNIAEVVTDDSDKFYIVGKNIGETTATISYPSVKDGTTETYTMKVSIVDVTESYTYYVYGYGNEANRVYAGLGKGDYTYYTYSNDLILECNYVNADYPEGDFEYADITSVEVEDTSIAEVVEEEGYYEDETDYNIIGYKAGETKAIVTYVPLNAPGTTATMEIEIVVSDKVYVGTSSFIDRNHSSSPYVMAGETVQLKLTSNMYEYSGIDADGYASYDKIATFDDTYDIKLNLDGEDRVEIVKEGELTLSEDGKKISRIYDIFIKKDAPIKTITLNYNILKNEKMVSTASFGLQVASEYCIIEFDEQTTKKLEQGLKLMETITFTPQVYHYTMTDDGVKRELDPDYELSVYNYVPNGFEVTLNVDGSVTLTRVNIRRGFVELYPEGEITCRWRYISDDYITFNRVYETATLTLPEKENLTIDLSSAKDYFMNPFVNVTKIGQYNTDGEFVALEITPEDYIAVDKDFQATIDVKKLKADGYLTSNDDASIGTLQFEVEAGDKECKVEHFDRVTGVFTVYINEHEHQYSDIFTIDVEATDTVSGSKSRHCTFEGCESKVDVTVIPSTTVIYSDAKDLANKESLTEEDKVTLNQTVDNLTNNKTDSNENAQEILENSGMTMEEIMNLDELYIANNENVNETKVEADDSVVGTTVEGAALAVAKYIPVDSGETYSAKVSVENKTKFEDSEAEIQTKVEDGNAYVLDINLSVVNSSGMVVKGAEDVQPAAPMRIAIPVPTEWKDKEFELYHYTDAGKTEKINYELVDGKIVFTVTALSYYALEATEKDKHIWSDWEVTAPTCQKEGYTSRTCSHCNEVETKNKTAKIAHDKKVSIPAVAATVDSTGLTEGKKCSMCGVVIVERSVIPKLEPEHVHSYTYESNNDATVLANGTKTGTCSCGLTETVEEEGTKLSATIKVPAKKFAMKVKQSYKNFTVTMGKGDSIVSVVSKNTKLVKVSKLNKTKGTFTLTAQKKTGKNAKVIITLASGKTQTLTITVQKGDVKTSKITGLANITLKKGKTTTLKPVITPITSTQKVTYKTSNKKVATVNAKGVVTGKKKGTAKITVASGSKKKVIKVTVK